MPTLQAALIGTKTNLLDKMTIGTYTFYTIRYLFAIENSTFFKKLFEFIVNSCLYLLKITKKKKILFIKAFVENDKYRFYLL